MLQLVRRNKYSFSNAYVFSPFCSCAQLRNEGSVVKIGKMRRSLRDDVYCENVLVTGRGAADEAAEFPSFWLNPPRD
jgi:hypothetical protein